MDFKKAFGAEVREVDERTRDGKATRVVSASRIYPTDQSNLWGALTNVKRISNWFAPVSGELYQGGRYQIEGNAGGTITRCEEPLALDLTWELGASVSWVTVRLETQATGTCLILKHEMLKDKTSEAHWKKYGPGATGVGWDLSFFGLGIHICNDGEQLEREANLSWMISDVGKDFMRDSAEAWSKAHISSGENEKIAQAMTARTAAFYTGEG